jgi:hypothetical protein
MCKSLFLRGVCEAFRESSRKIESSTINGLVSSAYQLHRNMGKPSNPLKSRVLGIAMLSFPQ